jgi:glycosyltransferase involved in cell wall biosynthesis
VAHGGAAGPLRRYQLELGTPVGTILAPYHRAMHVVVVTCAHVGDDARIVHRQARSLLQAGHSVTLVSPAPATDADDPPGLVRVPIPRATGRRRLHAWRAARRAVRRLRPDTDLLLIHDPELVVALVLARRRSPVPVIWDVHEDFAASALARAWIPAPLRPAVARLVTHMERRTARRCRIILAEHSYTARFPGAPVVPNSTWTPPMSSGPARPPFRVVYIGRVSNGRGLQEMLQLGERLDGEITVQIIGPADADVASQLRDEHDRGTVVWHGPLPNPVALYHLDGALAGLSLLHDEPNYHHSQPTKVLEYLAHGVPVLSTPLPLAAELIHRSGGGVVVPFGDVPAVADAITRLARDPAHAADLGAAGREHVSRHHCWQVDGQRFVELLESWSASRV